MMPSVYEVGEESVIENVKKKSSVSRGVAETELHRDNRHVIERDLVERRSSLWLFNGGHGANDKWSVNIATRKRDEYSNRVSLRRLGVFSLSPPFSRRPPLPRLPVVRRRALRRSPHLLVLRIDTYSFRIGKTARLYANDHPH